MSPIRPVYAIIFIISFVIGNLLIVGDPTSGVWPSGLIGGIFYRMGESLLDVETLFLTDAVFANGPDFQFCKTHPPLAF